MTIDELVREAWAVAEAKGFHAGRDGRGRDDTLVRLCLVHSEVTEAAQVVKRHGVAGREAEIAAELADVLIRVADLAGCLGLDLGAAVAAKMAANRGRPHLYGTPGAAG